MTKFTGTMYVVIRFFGKRSGRRDEHYPRWSVRCITPAGWKQGSLRSSVSVVAVRDGQSSEAVNSGWATTYEEITAADADKLKGSLKVFRGLTVALKLKSTYGLMMKVPEHRGTSTGGISSATTTSAPSTPSASSKRSRDPEDEVYLDNLHSSKRYLSEIMASSLNGITAGREENLSESPAKLDSMLCLSTRQCQKTLMTRDSANLLSAVARPSQRVFLTTTSTRFRFGR
ncbi:hypothetical protein MLD38_021674 [Melastoma candidum]|uniref:Uncharacterized protein n=1 Tax=Melastoma candidum TaxID=119954 RepID=A0ACB9QGW5_9MYRT|nr:hypothetical protein MLD38_021674 [Melastoma candidum]